jgi:hypothetical protein
MKKLWIMMALGSVMVRAGAQGVNPQASFSSAVSVNKPSLWLNYNDATANFKDSISGLSFAGGVPPAISAPTSCSNAVSSGTSVATCVMTVTAGDTAVLFAYAQSSTISTLVDSGGATCNLITSGTFGSGPAYAYSCANLTAGSHTFTMTLAGSTGYPILQGVDVAGAAAATPIDAHSAFNSTTASSTTFNSGALTTTLPDDLLVGWVLGSSGSYTLNGPVSHALSGGGWTGILPSSGYALTPGSYAFSGTQANAGGYTAIVVAVKSASIPVSTVVPQQPGFDNTNGSNFSAKFPYNSFGMAPNVSVGSTMEWNTPWTMMIHVNKMNWDRAGVYTLASKGDIGNIQGTFWRLYVQQNNGNGNASQLCFMRNAYAAPVIAVQTYCTAKYVDMVPNAFNYDIVIEDAGTGAIGAISMWINGYAVPLGATQSFGAGFGGVTAAITSAGSGFTAPVNFTSTGGGTNCVVTGTATESGGSLNAIPVLNSSGCTSTPTIVLTSPTGTGAVITATSYATPMNSSSYPLMVPGYVSNGVYYGAGGTDATQGALNVDEFAEFPGDLPVTAISNIFYETKFYQNLLLPGIQANPPLVIFEGYGCGPDFSGDQTLAMVIGEAKAGVIRLIATIDDDGGSTGSNGTSQGWWRQMLDEAGMNDVAVGVGSNSPGANPGGCPAATITAYNASTPQNESAYPSAASVIRKQYAKYPTKPIYFLMTQTATGYNDFQLSAADGISSLTGLQLQAQNAANGGWVNGFNGNLGVDSAAYVAVFNNNGTTPIYMWGGAPDQGGPGVYTSRTANDPLYLVAVNNTQDAITGWTNLNATQMISPYFFGGITLAYSGGTGYAAATAFTSTGGGPNCNVSGIMTASGGVPNGIETPWGINISPFTGYWGLGYGCTSTPTIVLTAPTGTGVILTPSLGTFPASYGGANVNRYTIYPNQWAAISGPQFGNAPIFRWFQNSFIDPPTTGAPRRY